MESMELMQRVHAGDGEAFKTLYGRYSQVVYRVAFQELGDQAQSLSVVKSVFRTVYDTLRERGPIEGDFYGWLDAQTARELRLLLDDVSDPVEPTAAFPPGILHLAAGVPVFRDGVPVQAVPSAYFREVRLGAELSVHVEFSHDVPFQSATLPFADVRAAERSASVVCIVAIGESSSS